MRSAPRRFSGPSRTNRVMRVGRRRGMLRRVPLLSHVRLGVDTMGMVAPVYYTADMVRALPDDGDRKSTRLNSSHTVISYAVFCLKKKKNKETNQTHANIAQQNAKQRRV